MVRSVKLSDDVMSVVRRESSLQSRSVAEQITHWINMGQAIGQSGAFDYRHINETVAGARSPNHLTAEEQEVWFAQFAVDVTAPAAQEETFSAQRCQLDIGVGLNDKGELVHAEEAAHQ